MLEKFERYPLLSGLFLKMPAAYKALNRLHQKGFLNESVQPSGNAPPKKVYSITNKGIAYFRQLLAAFLQSPETGYSLFWLAIRFAFKNLHRSEFIQVLGKRSEFVQNLQPPPHIKEKLERRTAMGDFVIPIFRESMQQIRKIELDALEKLKAAAQKPENDLFFLEDSQ